MSKRRPRITGTGYCLPEKLRYNNDPVFDWLRANVPKSQLDQMFAGYSVRHVLEEGETLIDIMVPAAKQAMDDAGLGAEDIDILIGWGSIAAYYQPNVLLDVHHKLGLNKSVWSIPVCDDYSNFNSAVILADGLLRAGRARNILICIGGNWTRNVDYHTGQSVSAADGAGAAVMSMSNEINNWYVADQYTVTDSSYYGSMFTNGIAFQADPPMGGRYGTVYSPHFFQITDRGMEGFKAFGEVEALQSVTELLKRNDLSPTDISFMPHQTSSVLIDYWVKHLSPAPAQVLSTIKQIANTTVATHAINLAWFERKGCIEKDLLVTLALGPGMHATSMLFGRG